jgi:hypothetical protein
MSLLDIMNKLNLLDWYILLVGFEHNWCNRRNLIEFAESCLHKEVGNIDSELIDLVEGRFVSDQNFMYNLVRFLERDDHSGLEFKKNEAFEKWRLVHLIALLINMDSDEQKVLKLQELYCQFGFPEDMRSCSIYSDDGVDPLDAARNVIQKLLARFTTIALEDLSILNARNSL